MIKHIAFADHKMMAPLTKPQDNGAQNKFMTMETQSRTAGSVPVWKTAHKPGPSVVQRFTDELPQQAAAYETSYSVNATAQKDASSDPPSDQSFGFGDLIDMINPLHHIPVLGSV